MKNTFAINRMCRLKQYIVIDYQLPYQIFKTSLFDDTRCPSIYKTVKITRECK